MNSFLKQFILPILVVGLLSNSLSCGYKPYHSGGEDCKNASSRLFGKPYERNQRSCCKDTIISTSYLPTYSTYGVDNPEKYCFRAAGPDDDLATGMWKEAACKWKIRTNMTEEDFTFKTVVNHLTKGYSNSSGVQQLIRDANTECPDGDNEEEFHLRLQRYLNCFFSNEQKTCNNPTPEGVKEMNGAVFIAKNSTIQSTLTCAPMPGIWNEANYCCAGKQTPQFWRFFYPGIFKLLTFNYTEYQRSGSYELQENCENSIIDIISTDGKNKIATQTDATTEISENSDENTDSKTSHKSNRFLYLRYYCFAACHLNPVIYTNDSSSPDVKLGFKKELDLYFPDESHELQRDLKEIVLRNKNRFKVSVKMDPRDVQTYLTLEEIENQYSSLESSAMKARYYCAYYDGISRLVSYSQYGYCVSDEALIHQLDPSTRPDVYRLS